MRKEPCCSVEPLEARRMLSASITKAGVLKLTGTNDSDNFVVSRSNNKIVVMQGDVRKAFSESKVKSINVRGDDGNDRVDLSGVNFQAKFTGDEGDDTLLGSQGSDDASGENGDDSLVGNGGNDSLRGGKGEDTLRGGKGNDELRGDEQRDSLYGDAGNDSLDANDDVWEDDLFGGKGFDRAHIDDEVGIEDETTSVEDITE